MRSWDLAGFCRLLEMLESALPSRGSCSCPTVALPWTTCSRSDDASYSSGKRFLPSPAPPDHKGGSAMPPADIGARQTVISSSSVRTPGSCWRPCFCHRRRSSLCPPPLPRMSATRHRPLEAAQLRQLSRQTAPRLILAARPNCALGLENLQFGQP